MQFLCNFYATPIQHFFEEEKTVEKKSVWVVIFEEKSALRPELAAILTALTTRRKGCMITEKRRVCRTALATPGL